MKCSNKAAITAACLFIFILITGSLYVYNKVNKILSAPSLEQLLATNDQDKLTIFSGPKPSKNSASANNQEAFNEQEAPDSSIRWSFVKEQNDSQQAKPSQSASSSNASENSTALDDKVASTIQEKVGSPVETSDMFKAGLILMSKLNQNEIDFLFGISSRTYTSEELNEVRRLLLSKLNDQDVATLRALAEKYGKNLDILDPNVPIE